MRSACPVRPRVQATAITFTLPLKAGIGKLAFAVPSGATLRTPVKNATGGWVGTSPSSPLGAASPPERICPRVPCMPSIRKP